MSCIIYQYLESYLKSDQRHCGQVEQGITNIEVKSRITQSSLLEIRYSIFIHLTPRPLPAVRVAGLNPFNITIQTGCRDRTM